MRQLLNEFEETVNSWKLKSKVLEFSRLPVLMGILNVTPDSFSDGGRFFDSSKALDQALSLVDQGAGIVDVGGESTRPYSSPVTESQELDRTVKIVQRISEATDVPVSIDTSKAKVAEECLAAGAEIINDVTGLEGDPKMVSVASGSKAGVCAMHMQGTPQDMQDDPNYEDVVEDIFTYLQCRKQAILNAGIDEERICLDPGIGFGKTHRHNLELIAGCHRFHQLKTPILVGHSRKGFIAKCLGDKDRDRSAATAGVAVELARKGIQILRVHDVQVVKDTLLLFDAVGGLDGQIANIL